MDSITKKVVFFGDPNIGKTYLLISIFFNHFDHNITYLPEWAYTTEANGKEVRLRLCDTNSHCDRLFSFYFLGCDLVVLCFSIDEKDSLKNIEEFWMPLIRQYLPKVPIVLVANKLDLRWDPATILERSIIGDRLVSSEDGRNMAAKIGACSYFECSAVTKTNIMELVQNIALMVTINSSSEPKKKKDACRIS